MKAEGWMDGQTDAQTDGQQTGYGWAVGGWMDDGRVGGRQLGFTGPRLLNRHRFPSSILQLLRTISEVE